LFVFSFPEKSAIKKLFILFFIISGKHHINNRGWGENDKVKEKQRVYYLKLTFPPNYLN